MFNLVVIFTLGRGITSMVLLLIIFVDSMIFTLMGITATCLHLDHRPSNCCGNYSGAVRLLIGLYMTGMIMVRFSMLHK